MTNIEEYMNSVHETDNSLRGLAIFVEQIEDYARDFDDPASAYRNMAIMFALGMRAIALSIRENGIGIGYNIGRR